MRRFLIVLLVLPLFAFADEIYQTEEKDGSITYTDQPAEGAKKVELPPIQVYEPQSEDSGESEEVQADPDKSPSFTKTQGDKVVKYNSININQPADQMTVRDNNGFLLVDVQVEPYLDPTHQVVLLIDDKPSPEPKAGQGEQQNFDFSLMNIDRGTHTIVAQIQDAKQAVILASAPITFYMKRGPGNLQRRR